MIDFGLLVAWLQTQLDADEREAAEDLRSIQRHDQGARTLVEVDSKRRILGNCEAVMNGSGWPGLAQVTVRLLTLPYAARPGYRDEWQVTS